MTLDPRLATQFDLPLEGTVDAAGELDLVIESRIAINWIITQVSVEMPDAPAGSTCEIRKDGSFVTALIPTGDAAGGDPPLVLRPGQQALVRWAGCTPGDVGRVLVIYDRVGFPR